MNPEISVIIPTYNRVDRVHQAVLSARMQTFKNIEIVVVDDCSTNNTWEMLNSWMLNEPRLKLYKCHQNSGSPVIPRNFGVSLATGKYLAFLDSDDSWEINKLETQLNLMKMTGAKFSYHNMQLAYDDGREELWSKTAGCHSDKVFQVLLKKNFIPTSSVLMERWMYEYFGRMDMSLDISHDWDLWLRIAFQHNILYCNSVLGTLRMHEGSVISEVHKRRKECRTIVRKWLSYVDGMWYRKIMLYYYMMEVFDILPRSWQERIRRRWYNQEKYK